MSHEKTQEILQQISALLNSLNESETEPKETKQEKVEMLTVRECSEVIKDLTSTPSASSSHERKFLRSEQVRARTEKYSFLRRLWLRISTEVARNEQ